ncbi:30S ribosomal protein S4 [Candidatus Pacearchaeota archaeon]|nr:30S ribosomal protein S4 [Candidatus Pacearchaeota archaeon]
MMFGKKHSKYKRPRKLYDKYRIEAEKEIVKKYGLKNKKEIWKAEAAIESIRRRGKMLIVAEPEKQRKFVSKLKKMNFDINEISDVLALNKEDWLKRRLQTIVYEKKLSESPKQARQLIVHKHIAVGDHIINKPSYMVDMDDEKKIRRVNNG